MKNTPEVKNAEVTVSAKSMVETLAEVSSEVSKKATKVDPMLGLMAITLSADLTTILMDKLFGEGWLKEDDTDEDDN